MSTCSVPSTPSESIPAASQPHQPAASDTPSPEPPASPEQPKTPQPPAVLLNSIVQRCCSAYQQAYATEIAKSKGEYSAHKKAAAAYLKAMPYLTARTAIRAYLACVAQALQLDIVSECKAAKLLQAAQLARAGFPSDSRPQPRPVGRPKKENPLPEK